MPTWVVKPSGLPNGLGQLEYYGNSDNEAQAEAQAEAALKDKNKDKITASITVPGNTSLVAGVNINLTGVGKFSGKWLISRSTHSVEPSGGYTSNIDARKILQE